MTEVKKQDIFTFFSPTGKKMESVKKAHYFAVKSEMKRLCPEIRVSKRMFGGHPKTD
jgi:hypothetical protein